MMMHVRLFLVTVGSGSVFTDENMRVHRPHIIKQCLKSETLLRMKLTAHRQTLILVNMYATC